MLILYGRVTKSPSLLLKKIDSAVGVGTNVVLFVYKCT